MIDSIRINLIGNGCLIIKANLNNELYARLIDTAKKLNSTIEEAIFDIEFFTLLNEDRFQSIQNFEGIKFNGLLLDTESHIEIRLNKKKNQKIRTSELLSDNELLFPLFNKQFINIPDELKGENGIAIIEKEVGMIRSYKLSVEKFNIDNLKFIIHRINIGNLSYSLISDLSYENCLLNNLKSDTLVSGNFAFIRTKTTN